MTAISTGLRDGHSAHSRSPTRAITDSDFNSEFTSLCAVASSVRASASVGISSLAISAEDVARDVLIKCGGLGHVPRSLTAQVDLCQQSLGRVASRRRLVPERLLLARRASSLQAAVLRQLDEGIAVTLHRGLHCLGMERPGGKHFGLYSDALGAGTQSLLAAATISAFDLHHLVPRLLDPEMVANAVVLSRVVTLPGAPRNSVSRMLGAVFSWLRSHSPVELLFSYNNPNLGFQGTIYKATNWRLVGFEEKLEDLLLDGEYLSRREALARFGTTSVALLYAMLGPRMRLLPQPKQPLEIYRYELYDKTSHALGPQ